MTPNILSRRSAAAIALMLVLSAPLATVFAGADEDVPRVSLPPATRGPVAIAFTPDGAKALVAESDEGTVAVVDTATGSIRARFPSHGKEPAALAVPGDGTMVVVNRFSGSVVRLDIATGKPLAWLALRGVPSGIALSRDGRTAFVSVSQLDYVAALELPDLRVRRHIPVGHRPESMALTRDGRTLLIANFQGGDVSAIDTAALRETGRIPLGGVNLRGIAVAPDGRRAFVTGQIPHPARITADPRQVWRNTVFEIGPLSSTPQGTKGPAVRAGALDSGTASSPDPDGIAAVDSEHLVLALSGSDQALRVRVEAGVVPGSGPVVELRAAAGAHPRGIALTPDGRQVWVANELDSTLSVLDAATLSPLRRIPLGIPRRRELRLEGRYIFGSAGLTQGHRFTCSTCHPDGNADGLTWKFAHVRDGLVSRNTRSLRGGVTMTAPFRWSGHTNDIEEFFQEEITGLMHGPRQPHSTLHPLWNLLDQFPLPPNPYRLPNGRLTEAARRGRALFAGKGGCAGCHAGEMHGGTGKKAWVGTTRAGLMLDVPHVAGACDSAPYLHDGRAATLAEIFGTYNRERKHGQAQRLSAKELQDLLEYVREL